MGNRPKPTKLKILEGNPGKQKLNKTEPEPPPGHPQMPEWLSSFPEAVKEWDRESEILFTMGLLTVADAGTFATRCYLASQIQEAALNLKSSSEKRYTQIKALITEYRQLGSLFGLDSCSRTKLAVEMGSKKKSKFNGLIQAKK